MMKTSNLKFVALGVVIGLSAIIGITTISNNMSPIILGDQQQYEPSTYSEFDIYYEQLTDEAVQEAIIEQEAIEDAYERQYGSQANINPMLTYWERAVPPED